MSEDEERRGDEDFRDTEGQSGTIGGINDDCVKVCKLNIQYTY